MIILGARLEILSAFFKKAITCGDGSSYDKIKKLPDEKKLVPNKRNEHGLEFIMISATRIIYSGIPVKIFKLLFKQPKMLLHDDVFRALMKFSLH